VELIQRPQEKAIVAELPTAGNENFHGWTALFRPSILTARSLVVQRSDDAESVAIIVERVEGAAFADGRATIKP
jgi:hypothetical protein